MTTHVPSTLVEFIIEQQSASPNAKGELSQILGALSFASKIVHREINRAGLVDIAGNSGDINVQGEQQQKLDLYANEKFKQALAARGHVCGLASEEEDSFVEFFGQDYASNKYVVAIDPIDGSSNIEVNIPVGTIFSVYRRVSDENQAVHLEDFLRCGTEQVAAGYVIYGSSTMLVYTTGQGVNGFTYDPSIGEFLLSHENLSFPASGSIFSINEGNFLDFDDGLKKYLEACKTGANQLAKPYSARYIGSLVADFHRNLLNGGIYIYPALNQYPEGKLRLLYEAHPMAFIAEQAGGMAIVGHAKDASDGPERILALKNRELHQRVPLVIGAKNLVEEYIQICQSC